MKERPYIRKTVINDEDEGGQPRSLTVIAVNKRDKVRQMTFTSICVDQEWAEGAFLEHLRREKDPEPAKEGEDE